MTFAIWLIGLFISAIYCLVMAVRTPRIEDVDWCQKDWWFAGALCSVAWPLIIPWAIGKYSWKWFSALVLHIFGPVQAEQTFTEKLREELSALPDPLLEKFNELEQKVAREKLFTRRMKCTHSCMHEVTRFGDSARNYICNDCGASLQGDHHLGQHLRDQA
jgi:ribosomal protein S27E